MKAKPYKCNKCHDTGVAAQTVDGKRIRCDCTKGQSRKTKRKVKSNA